MVFLTFDAMPMRDRSSAAARRAGFRFVARRLQVTLLALAASVPAAAAEWTTFKDPDLGFRMDIPPGYERVPDTGQENALFFHNDAGDILALWSNPPGDDSFESDVAEHLVQDQSEGWDLSYERMTSDWVSYSGTKDGQIRYVRAINLCGDGAGYFTIEYSQAAKLQYDSIVTRMVRSMEPTRC